MLGNRHLIDFTIEAAKKAKSLDYFLVSTDDDEIAKVSRECGASVPFKRPAKISEDIDSVYALRHALEWYERRKKKQVSHIVCLQPTSPFKKSQDIDRCVQLAKRTGADTVITIAQAKQHPMWCFEMNQFTQRLQPFIDIRLGGDNLVWQNLPLVFYPNGAVYVTRRDMILDGRIFGDKIHGVLTPQERSLDLEEHLDFIVASALLPIIQKGEPLLKTSWLDA